MRERVRYNMPRRSFKQILRDWLYNNEECEAVVCEDMSLGQRSIDSDRGINFKVFKASGGTIIETSFYDRQKDRHHNSLHVITDDQDIGKEIGKIITMETLKF